MALNSLVHLFPCLENINNFYTLRKRGKEKEEEEEMVNCILSS
jgi:hypothetical protein